MLRRSMGQRGPQGLEGGERGHVGVGIGGIWMS